MRSSFCCLALFASLNPSALAQHFVDVTASLGIDYDQFASLWIVGPEPHFMTGGAAAGDFDGDGRIDLYVTRMDAEDILYRNTPTSFVALSGTATGLTAGDGSNGAAWADVDNDGDLDLYVTTVGEIRRNYLYINDGGLFTEEAVERGAEVPQSQINPTADSFSVSFGDYDADGFLDLFTCAWDDRLGEGTRLLRNVGTAAPGTFIDVTDAAGVAMQNYPNLVGYGQRAFAFAAQFADIDRDGFQDLVVAGDFGTSRIFWNDGDGTFTDGNPGSGFGIDENGMGLALGDVDGDGFLDVFITSIFDPSQSCETAGCYWGYSGNRLYRYAGNRQFEDWTDAKGVRDGGWGWGARFLDYDRDMRLDLVMTNGIRFPYTWDDAFEFDPMRLWHNNGVGVWSELATTEGIVDHDSGKGLLSFDYDNDGDLDLFVVNNAGTPVLYRNDSVGSWLKVELVGVLSNPRGLGAQIDVMAGGVLQSSLIASGGFLGDGEKRAVFGLGNETEVDWVRVNWPRGNEQLVTDVAVNHVLVIEEQFESSTAAPPEPRIPQLSAEPNPFNPRTTIRFELAEPTVLRVSIFDLRGREIRALKRGSFPAGEYRSVWDGRDERGTPVATGHYRCELLANGRATSIGVTLLK